MRHECPPLDPALLRWLDETYPEKSPAKDERYGELMWRGGVREVVRKLKVEFERQQEPPNVSRKETPKTGHSPGRASDPRGRP
jgi:hypothetical protein